MPALKEHPTILKLKQSGNNTLNSNRTTVLDATWLRKLCLTAGADDAGFVEIERKALEKEVDDIKSMLPGTRALIVISCKINRDNIRTPSRSIANTEFRQSEGVITGVSRKIVSALNDKGIRAISSTGLFPLEMDQWPGKIWDISLKPLAVAAGLGHMGVHRMVIHPKFGSFMYLCAILVDSEISGYDTPLNYNPCLECKLCAVTCPTGAVAPDSHFDFFSCITHNYREKLGGFSDWVENIVDSRNRFDYRKRADDPETASMWQSLATGGSTKCDQCMAVCPAGEDVIRPFLDNRKSYIKRVVEPLRKKVEKVYVVPGSDAESHVARRFPHKEVRQVGNGLRPNTVKGFLDYLPKIFQRGKAAGLNATYHFTFTGAEEIKATVVIRDKKIEITKGHTGTANLRVRADSRAWLGFLAKERKIAWLLVSAKVRIKGPPKLLPAFGRCFPS